MKQLGIIFILLSIFNLSFSQDEYELKEIFFTAEDHFFFEEYYDAIPFYKELSDADPENANYLYKLGACYVLAKIDILKAIDYLKKASKNINEYYQDGYFKGSAAPSEVYYYLGMAYHLIDSLDLAEKYYRKYKNKIDVYDLASIDFANHLIKTCKNGRELMNSPVNFKSSVIENQPLNFSEYDYYLISGDNSTKIYFYKSNQEIEIYFSKKNHPSWEKPMKIENLSNADYFIYPTSLSFNGYELFLSFAEKYDKNIYVAVFENNSWSEPEKLNKNINTRFEETHAFLSKDGSTLYFTSNQKKGFGGKDIYASYKDSKGEWDKPINLGNTINSEYNEESPFLSYDEKTIYYSSEGHFSMGGYDIFYSSLDKKGKWTKPVNVGYPVNTTDNNLYYLPGKTNDYAYISAPQNGDLSKYQLVEIHYIKEEKVAEEPISNVTTETSITEADSEIKIPDQASIKETTNIVKPEKVLLNGKITLQDENYKNANILIKIKDNQGNIINSQSLKNNEGKFSFKLQKGLYSINANAIGYASASSSINIPESYQQNEINFELKLIPAQVEKGDYVAIKNIFFNYDSYKLTKDAQIELIRISKYLQRNPSVIVEIYGYTDDLGNDKYNLQLSEKRANTVYSYITSSGIANKRLQVNASGENHNIAINKNPDGSDNPTGRSFNRRVELQLKNTDQNIEIEDNLYIPEYLRIKEKATYTIFISNKLQSIDTNTIRKLSGSNLNFKIHSLKQGKILTIGDNEDKGSLIPLLNKLIDAGYSDSKIINILEINNLFKTESKELVNIDAPIYTIQIIAILYPVKVSYFKGLEDVNKIKCDDGYYRYTYGEFYFYKEAEKELQKLKKLNYKSAYIRKIEDLPNYYE